MSGYADRTLSGLRWSTGGLWYQFITTGPVITSYSGETGPVFNGSAVAVKLPKVQADGSVVWENITPIATGSTLEVLPDGTPKVSSITETQRIQGMVQVELIPEPSYRVHENLEADSSYRQYKQLVYSWSSIQGSVYNAGALMPTPAFGFSDKSYDNPPTTISGKRFKVHEPDMDWPHDAAIVRITSEEFGSRAFIVAVDASSRFYCWPYQDDEFADLGSPYAEQGQRITVPSSKVQSLEAPFPTWVHVPVGDRRDTDWPMETNSGEPRYVWRFHPQGTKVVGLVLNREAFAGDLWIENVTNDGSGNFTDESYIEEDWAFSVEDLRDVSYTGVPKTDLPGYVEFSIAIELTGLETTDFTFGLTLLQEQLSNANHYYIAADYLSPVLGGWSSYEVSGTPGDLVVMELEARRGPMSDFWWKMEGSSERPERYFRQLWTKVVNVETSSVLQSFLILDQPDDYLHSCAYLDKEEQFILSGALVGMDLSKLTFTYQARRQRFFVDAEEYYAEEYDTFSGFWFGLLQRWMEEEAGIRVYAFNQVVKEVQGGEDFDLWSTVDALTVEAASVVASPVEVGRKGLLASVGSFSNKNILAYLFNIPYARHVTEEFIVGTPPDEEDIRTTLSYELLNSETTDDIEYATYNAFNSVITNANSNVADISEIKSDILVMLNEISDATIDETFVETWVYPWVKQQLAMAINQIDSVDIIEDTEHIGRYIPVIVFKLGYGNLFEAMTSIDYTHFWGSYFFHYRAYQRPAEPLSSFTFPTLSGFQTPWLHDYAIGRDAYLHGWWLAFRPAPYSVVCACPEGFYAGTHDLFYANQPIPETSLYSVGHPDFTALLNKDRYFVNRAWGRSSDPVSIRKNAKYSLVNKPPANCLSQLRVDVVGHLSGGQTTHEAWYEAAYEKTLTLPTPEIRVTNITSVGHYYRYEYIYEAKINGYYRPVEPSYPDFQVETLRLAYNPILNGSMLFSK